MEMSIYSKEGEKVKFEEIVIELKYLSKRWNIYFEKTCLGNDWKISGYPKKELKKEIRK